MIVRIQLFAAARDRAGQNWLDLEMPEAATVGALKRKLREVCPAIANILAHAMLAVDADYASDEVVVSPSSQIALIPPVSGG